MLYAGILPMSSVSDVLHVPVPCMNVRHGTVMKCSEAQCNFRDVPVCNGSSLFIRCVIFQPTLIALAGDRCCLQPATIPSAV